MSLRQSIQNFSVNVGVSRDRAGFSRERAIKKVRLIHITLHTLRHLRAPLFSRQQKYKTPVGPEHGESGKRFVNCGKFYRKAMAHRHWLREIPPVSSIVPLQPYALFSWSSIKGNISVPAPTPAKLNCSRSPLCAQSDLCFSWSQTPDLLTSQSVRWRK